MGLSEDLRCKRNDGGKWRCGQKALHGKSYCEKHLAQLKKRGRKKNSNEGVGCSNSGDGETVSGGRLPEDSGPKKRKKRSTRESDGADREASESSELNQVLVSDQDHKDRVG